MPRRRITISDWDDDSQHKGKRPNNPLLTRIALLAIICFALYGMKECYRQYPPKIFHPQPQTRQQ